MNGTHLPAGQSMPGAGGAPPVARGSVDMGPGSTGGRRRPPPQYPSHQHHHHQQQYHHQPHVSPMYHNSYMNPYANSYYPQVPPHYQNGAMMHNAAYMGYNPYPQHPQRSPPPMHQQYPAIVSSTMQPPQPYSRPPPQQHQQPPVPPPQQQQQQHPPPPPPPQQPSPAIATPPPYQTAPPPAAVPHTPSSTHSSHLAVAQSTPPTPSTADTTSVLPDVEMRRPQDSFKYPLPWLSRPDLPFPARAHKSRRRRRFMALESSSVELPTNQQVAIETMADTVPDESSQAVAENTVLKTPTMKTVSTSQGAAARSEASSTQDLPSETTQSTSATTPVSSFATQATDATPTKHTKQPSRAAIPAVPVVPILPKTSPKESRSTPSVDIAPSNQGKAPEVAASEKPAAAEGSNDAATTNAVHEPAPAPAKAAPKLWTGLFSSAAAANAASAVDTNTASSTPANVGGATDSTAAANGSTASGGFAKSNASSLAEALRTYKVNGGQKIPFLEPRGLINTGNMCYMNSVLQVLIFCIPFYDFLDQVGKKAAHSFKSETPLVDAMVMFMREYKVIDSAVSVDQLRRRLKNEELEQYGEPFTPEFVYDAIRQLPRFASMRRGHQQDAEEFLGFLLEALHDECTHVMRHLPDTSTASSVQNSSGASQTGESSPTSTTDDWLEVGRRQRAAVTRSSGHPVTSSPIAKVFGGQLRSELRVTGLKDSVTLEPFQPLQLDIGSSQVHNILDALKNLTKPETLHGDFGSPRGRDAVATKQVFIESLPPVLILHLKRFTFDTEGTGTIKIWKKVGYPLELELPKEVFSRQKRNTLLAEGTGLPRYRLMAAVYHHGKNASGGHYTVDLRRQDGREWIRLDDTAIRRVRSEDVAEGGVEEDNKSSGWSDGKKDNAAGNTGNRFEGIGDEDAGDDEGWNQVSATANGTKKWSNVLNGASNNAGPPKAKPIKDSIKDNKVAYLLFYQRV